MATVTPSAREQLKSYVERIERMEEEKAAMLADIRELYSAAKGDGFDVKAMRKIVSMRRKDEHIVREEEELISLYKDALGMG